MLGRSSGRRFLPPLHSIDPPPHNLESVAVMSDLTLDRQPPASDLKRAHELLSEYNRQFLPSEIRRWGFTLKNAAGELIGAADGSSYWGRTYLDMLWVSPTARGQGVGQRLMAEVERLAREHGSRGIDLWTMDFQAPGFYEKMGFTVSGTIAGYDEGHEKRFYSKALPRE